MFSVTITKTNRQEHSKEIGENNNKKGNQKKNFVPMTDENNQKPS